MSRRKVSNPLALAALACLAEKPMHPYEIASTLRERHKDASIKLNYGSLYSVIQALCRNQFIVAQETIRDGKRPERTVFRLTEAGNLELRDWLSELLARPVKEFTQFEAGLSLMLALPPATVVELLRGRCNMIEIELAKLASIDALTTRMKLPRLFVVENEYWTMLRKAELDWVRALADDIEAGRATGFDAWRDWHGPSAHSA